MLILISGSQVVPFEPPICAEGGVGGWLGSPNSLASGSTAIVEPELEAPEEWVQESEEEDEEKYAEYSCYAFERHNVLRAFCIALVENLWSDRVRRLWLIPLSVGVDLACGAATADSETVLVTQAQTVLGQHAGTALQRCRQRQLQRH